MSTKKKMLFRINEIQYIKTYYTVAESPTEALTRARDKKTFFLIRHNPHLHYQEPEKVVEVVADACEFNLVRDRFPKFVREVKMKR